MNSFSIFFAKELKENFRTKRVIVLGIVFLIFAISGPLLARFMGEFLDMMLPAGDDMADMMIAVLGNPVWQDSYAQYYSNLGQIGIVAIIFLYMGMIQKEVASGTSSLMFAKGLGFGAFVMAKFLAASIVAFVLSIVSGLVAYVYTLLLFDQAGSFGDVLLGAVVFGFLTMFVIALVTMCSAFGKTSMASGGLSFCAFVVFLLLSAVPVIGANTPFGLFSHPLVITIGGGLSRELLFSVLSALVIGVVAVLVAIARVKRAEG